MNILKRRHFLTGKHLQRVFLSVRHEAERQFVTHEFPWQKNITLLDPPNTEGLSALDAFIIQEEAWIEEYNEVNALNREYAD